MSTANGQLDAELEREASVIGLPNYCVVSVCGDETHLSAHGSSPSSGRSHTPDTWFSVASTGKHVTALVAMDLLQQKGVTPDRPIGDLLGGLPEYATRVSVGSLASHVSGLPEYLSYEEGEVPPDTSDGFRRQLEALEPVFQEGQSWMYSNSNYILLGELIASLGGSSYGLIVNDWLERRIGGGMAVASPAYVRAFNSGEQGEKFFDEESCRRTLIGDGDIAFTPAGADRWMRWMLSQVCAARGTFHQALDRPAMAGGRQAHYASGLFVEPSGSGTVVHHAGHYDGYTAQMMLLGERECAVMVMAENAPMHTRFVRHMGHVALSHGISKPFQSGVALETPEKERTEKLVYRAIYREAGELDPSLFEPSMLLPHERGGPIRGGLNLWTGVRPSGFDIVDRFDLPGETLYRIRVRYSERTEYLLVGLSKAGRISWAWPL